MVYGYLQFDETTITFPLEEKTGINCWDNFTGLSNLPSLYRTLCCSGTFVNNKENIAVFAANIYFPSGRLSNKLQREKFKRTQNKAAL